jgi:hypothetical protein
MVSAKQNAPGRKTRRSCHAVQVVRELKRGLPGIATLLIYLR